MDALAVLRDYIRIDTTNPPGGEGAAAEFLAQHLADAGLEPQILTDPDGRANVVARIRGEGPPGEALCLLHHMDVVPADPSEWSIDPFGADVKDGCVWGRGSLDTKSLGIMQLAAVEAVAREGSKPRRDVVYVANADEEAGGAHGAGWLCATHPDVVDCQWVLNEGGFGLAEIFPGVSTFGVAVTEKTVVWLRLRATGRPGHGSTPHDDQAVSHLLSLLAEVVRPRPLRVTPVVADGFRVLAAQASVPLRTAIDALTSQVGRTVVSLAGSPFSGALPPGLRALLRDTVTITSIEAGYKENVIPGKAEAVLDCRLLPDTDADLFIAEIRQRAAEHGAEVDVLLRGEAQGIDRAGPMLDWITAAAAEHVPEVVVSETVCPGFTDTRFFRALGAHGVGLTPALVTSDILQGFHGIDERLPTEGLELGLRMVGSIVRNALRPE